MQNDRMETIVVVCSRASAAARASTLARARRQPRERPRRVVHRSRTLIAKGRGDIDIVSQVETLDAYRGLREDLTRSTYTHYVVELTDAFAEEGR
jgi:recombinational DNA repair protein (RecF pathway)